MSTETTPNRKPTMAGLFAFVKSKPESEEIDNRDWSVCAVGLYLESLGILLSREGTLRERFPEEYEEAGQVFIDELKGIEVTDSLYSSFNSFGHLALSRSDTYGQLAYILEGALSCPNSKN